MVETKMALSIFAKPSNFYSFCKNHEIHMDAKTKVFSHFRNILMKMEDFAKAFVKMIYMLLISFFFV
jgi:hypothetical protein